MLTYLTKEQLAQIGQYLESLGIKDTAFLWSAPLTGNELLTLVQNNSNVKARLLDFTEWIRQFLYITGDFRIVQDLNELLNPATYFNQDTGAYMIVTGMPVSVLSEKAFYMYLGEALNTEQVASPKYWKALTDKGGVPIFTQAQIDNADSLDQLPDEYFNIGNPSFTGSPEGTAINVSKHSGDFLQIIFSTIRALQSEVAKLKNTFNYGIQSMTGTNTSFSYIESTAAEEKEPLWAIEPEQLSQIASLEMAGGAELSPSNAFHFDSEATNIVITSQCTTSSIANLYDDSTIEDPKVVLYAIVTANKDSVFKVHLTPMEFKDNGDPYTVERDLDLSQYLPEGKYNIMLIMSRVLTTIENEGEDNEIVHYYGQNYYWLNITDTDNNPILGGAKYFKEDYTTLQSAIPNLDHIPFIDYVTLNNITVWRLDTYTKAQGLMENTQMETTQPPTDDFTFKAAHITIRSVTNKAMLDSVKDKILDNELIWEEEKSTLYIKTNGTIKSIKSSSTDEEDDNTGMTQEEMITWLTSQNLIKLKEGSIKDYELVQTDLNTTFGSITFKHEKSGNSYEVTVDDTGTLRCVQMATTDSDVGGDNGTYSVRGAVAKYELGSEFETTVENIYSRLVGTTQVLYGDRVRISAWYRPNAGQTAFNCTHEFIEITNCSTADYPLEDAVLGIIMPGNASASTFKEQHILHEFPLTGTVKAGSSYLVRAKQLLDYGSSLATVKVTSYDIELYEGTSPFSIQGCEAILLYHKNSQGNVSSETAWKQVSTNSNFTYTVKQTFIDGVQFTTLKNNNTNLIADASYTVVDNAICKDQYALDPAKQAFRSLTGNSKESSNCRLAKVAAENIVLNEDTIEFPHSSGVKTVTTYAPKASYENKNILTDKTKPDFKKPNMVTVSFGIDAQTTRCFNWFSMGHTDEFVWIKKQGETSWTRFESYKEGDGTDTTITYTGKSLVRKEFNSTIIDSAYARVDNVFPGDSTYQYRTHKCIIYISDAIAANNNPITYEYVVGRSTKGGNPKDGYISDVQTFTMYPSDYKPIVFQTTDQQGFGWMEYQVWAAAAEEINNKISNLCSNANKTFPILVNTGDMTQNGTRVNEWIDYYEAGKCLFNHLEQMNVVGNNDLCNAYNETILGTGNDDGKSSPYYFHQFYCYEVDNVTSSIDKWGHPLIYNGVFVPSMYYFYFGNYAYVMCNSELTTVGCFAYWGRTAYGNSGDTVNLYTGYVYGGEAITTVKTGYLADTLNKWFTALKQAGKTIIVACHEMPFTVTTQANLASEKASVDRSLEGTSLVGSHMNRIGIGGTPDTWGTADVTYWFSKMMQNQGIKLCIGGHKHTYAITYPVADVQDSPSTVHYSKRAIIKRAKSSYSGDISNDLWQYDTNLSNGVVYFMCQATGFKLASNKELPSRYQAYSQVVPATSVSGSKSTADVSQTYPMYATFEYDANTIKANLYRVVNVKKETLQSTNKVNITEFSETAYATADIYSEKLLFFTKDNVSQNYWLIPNEYLKACSGYVGDTLKDIQRCVQSGSSYKYTADGGATSSTFTPVGGDHTIVVNL